MSVDAAGELVVTLPGGIVLDDGTRLDEAHLRPLSGGEERWLAEHSDAPTATAVTWLLTACVRRLNTHPVTRELVQRLLIGDRDYLMLQLRRITLGDTIRAVLSCPACTAKLDVDLQTPQVPIESRHQTAAEYEVPVGDTPGVRRPRVRLPTGGDQQAVLGMEIDAAAAGLLEHCIVDDGGTPLSAAEQTAVIEAMQRLAPQLDLELDLTCPECAHQFVVPFDTTRFFLTELAADRGQLLREIHWLAFYYHWSEADILRLTRARRRQYLALLHEAVRSE